MRLQFELIDRFNNTTVIDEPQGWDAMEIELKRDLETHGMFFDYQVNEFVFYGKARRIIEKEWNDYGIKGDITLVIKLRCGGFISWITGTIEYEELYRGKLLFGKYDQEKGETNSIKIPVETTDDIMEFKNRYDQKVDVQSLVAFDKTTPLVPYANLQTQITLPSKGILIQNRAENKTDIVADFAGDDECGEGGDTGALQMLVEIPMSDTTISELGGFYFGTSPTSTQILNSCSPPPFSEGDLEGQGAPAIGWFPDAMSPIVNYAEGMPNFGQVTAPVETGLKLKGSIELKNCTARTIRFLLMRFRNGGDPDISLDGDHETIWEYHVQDTPAATASPYTFYFDQTFTATIAVNPDDRFYMFMFINYGKTAGQFEQTAFTLTFETGNYFYMKTLSKLPPTDSKVFMINEVISRVAEAITNDKIRGYSEYFGRTDSQPYAVAADGCGSLEALTQGLFIRRQENRIPGKPFTFNISMQDIWKGIDPIHHLGMGIEADPNRPGFNRFRIEHWKHFYSNDVVMVLDNVQKIRTRTIENEHYSTFACGYDKWEAEEYNGIDECLTKRFYRTTFTQLKNELSKISTLIGSPYTWEVARRKSSDSKDFRYDNDTFIICLKRNNTGGFEVEVPNITLPENIIDPDTFYNWRIRPVYNAMRWIDKLHSGYRPGSAPDKLFFMDGTGNYHAKGEMTSTDCKLENSPLEENIDIDETLFADPDQAMPKVRPERVDIEYPMSLKDFRKVKQKPYGKIVYTGCESGEGWIDTLNYKPDEGMATFSLIPKY